MVRKRAHVTAHSSEGIDPSLRRIRFLFLFIFILKLSIVWLAVAYAVGNILDFVALLYLLDKKVGGFNKKKLLLPSFKMFLITIVTAGALYIPMKLLDQLVFDTTHVIGLIALTLTASVSGMLVYFILSWIFDIDELKIYLNLLKRVILFPGKLKAPDPTTIDAQNQTP